MSKVEAEKGEKMLILKSNKVGLLRNIDGLKAVLKSPAEVTDYKLKVKAVKNPL